MALALRATLEEAEALAKLRDSMNDGEGSVREVEGDSMPAGRGLSF